MTSGFSWQNFVVLCLPRFVLQGQISLLPLVSLDFLLLHSNSLWWRGYLFGISSRSCRPSLEPFNFSFFGISGRGIDLDCHDSVWLTLEMNRDRSFCCFWDCTQVLHFRLCCWLWGLFYFLWGILAHSSRYNGHQLNLPIPVLFGLLIDFLRCWRSLLPSPVWLLPIYLDSWT